MASFEMCDKSGSDQEKKLASIVENWLKEKTFWAAYDGEKQMDIICLSSVHIYIFFLIIPSPLNIFLWIALYLACCFGRIREEFGLQEIYTKDNSIHMSNIPNATEYNYRTRRISIPDKSGFIKYNISKLGNS